MNAIIVNQVILMSRIRVTENLKQFKFQAHNNQIEGLALLQQPAAHCWLPFGWPRVGKLTGRKNGVILT